MESPFHEEQKNRSSQIEDAKMNEAVSMAHDSNLDSSPSGAHPITRSPENRISASPDLPITSRWRSYRLLLVARLKEMYREPEVIFWVFIFPILLALGLGIAFRNKPADVSRVVLVDGPGTAQAMDLLHQQGVAGTVHADLLPAPEAFNQLSAGQVRSGGDASRRRI